MNRPVLTFLSALAAAAVIASPVAQASIVTDFKADLAKAVGTKKGAAAAKAANKVTAKYVAAPPKGDPKKLVTFTKLAIKAIQKVLDDKSTVGYVSQWSSKVGVAYFQKGKIKYSVNDSKFKAAYKKVNALLKGFSDSDVTTAFKGSVTLNNKFKGSSADLQSLADQTGKADGGVVPPVS